MLTTIYIDGSAALQPDARDRLPILADAGHELVLVAEDAHPADDLLTWSGRLRATPEEPAAGSWFLTADPSACGDRQPSLRTLLIGGRIDRPGPTRCDDTARDLREAVLRILADEAMTD